MLCGSFELFSRYLGMVTRTEFEPAHFELSKGGINWHAFVDVERLAGSIVLL
jgi:hypothetical protein